jgi:hypothetical protein
MHSYGIQLRGTGRNQKKEINIYIYTDPNLNNLYAGHTGTFYPVPGPNPATSVQLNAFNNAVFTTETSRTITSTYYFTVTAVASSIESSHSNIVSYTFT